MDTVKRIYKNILYMGGAELISKLLQFFIMIYAARLLDKASFGKFNFALSVYFMGIVLADFGINMLLVREISRNKQRASDYFYNASIIKLLLGVFAFAAVLAYLKITNYPYDTIMIVLAMMIFTVLSTFTDLFYSVFRAFEKMHLDAVVKLIRMFVLTILSIYVLRTYRDAFIFSVVFVIAELVALISAYILGKRKFLKDKFTVSSNSIREIVKKAIPFGGSFVLGAVYYYLGVVILSKLRGDIEVATYSAAYNLILAMLFIPTIYVNAIYPVMARFFKESKEGLVMIYRKSLVYLSIIAVPITIGTFMLAQQIISMLYGEKYSGSATVLRIVSATIFFKFMGFLSGYALTSIDQQTKRVKSQLFTAILSLVLNFWLINSLGYIGAAISALITEIFICYLYFWYSKKYLKYSFSQIYGTFFKIAMAGILMALTIKFMESFNTFLIVPTAGAIYFSVVYFTKVLDKEDIELYKRIRSV